MADRYHLTDKTVHTLEVPTKDQKFYRDAEQQGLALRVTANGARAFVVLHWDPVQKRELRYVVGSPDRMKVAAARKAVQARIGQAVIGVADPFGRAARKKSEITLRRVLGDYLAARSGLKERTREDYRKRVEEECFADWLDRPMVEISRDDIERKYTKLAGTSESRAKGGMVVLRALFNYAQAKYETAGKPVIVDNPIRRLTATRRGWSRVKRRSDAIPLALMPEFLRVARTIESSASDYLQAIALTGMRRNEAAHLEWRCIDMDGGTFIVEETKNRAPLRLPITRQLRQVLERRRAAQKGRKVWRYVFTQNGSDQPIAEARKTLAAVCKAIGHASTVHDLRRSFINAADASGQGFLITKCLVNHRLPTGAEDVTVGYTARDPERLRVAAQRVADILDGTIKLADVLPLVAGQGA